MSVSFKKVSFRCSEAEHNRLYALSVKNNLSISQMVRAILGSTSDIAAFSAALKHQQKQLEAKQQKANPIVSLLDGMFEPMGWKAK